MSNKVTYQPLQKITMQAAELLPEFRFVNYEGKVCGAGEKSFGVVEKNWSEGTFASIITLGSVPIDTSVTVHAGDALTSDADGKAKPAGTGDAINGRALETCVGSGSVKMFLVP